MSRGAWAPGPIASCLLAAALAACAQRPLQPADARSLAPTPVPARWSSDLEWQEARPAAHVDRGRWWQIFGDTELDALVEQALVGHPGLAAARARSRLAQANLAVLEADAWPRIDASARWARSRTSANRPAATAGSTATSSLQNDSTLGIAVAYELDLFDRVGQQTRGGQAAKAQAESDERQAALQLAADVASTYFNLRQIDVERSALDEALSLQERALDVFRARHRAGSASGLDLAQQEAQRDATRTQRDLLLRQRPVLEHALAALLGRPAGELRVEARTDWRARPPALPASTPGSVLQRRPDVAAAQWNVAAAQAQLGLARSARFPVFSLGANLGLESRVASKLFDAPSLLWSLGAGVVQSVFDGGRHAARIDAAQAGLELASEGYRSVVLRALQEAEDGLSGLRDLDRAARDAQAAEASARRAWSLAQTRYEGGLASSLEVVTAQQAWLTQRRQAVQIGTQQLGLSVFLVKALGGSWSGA